MNKKTLAKFVAFSAVATLSSQAALTWTGVSNNALFAEANWLDDNGVVPAGNVITQNVHVTAVTGGVIDILIPTNTPNNFGGGNFSTGANTVNIGGGAALGSNPGNFDGIEASSLSALTITGASSMNVQFVSNYSISLDTASTLTLRGGASPMNNTTVDLLDTGSQVLFLGETVGDFTSEHLSNFTVNGAAAVIGTNLSVVSDGGSGSIVTAIVPEPSSTTLLGLGGIALVLRRRK